MYLNLRYLMSNTLRLLYWFSSKTQPSPSTPYPHLHPNQTLLFIQPNLIYHLLIKKFTKCKTLPSSTITWAQTNRSMLTVISNSYTLSTSNISRNQLLVARPTFWLGAPTAIKAKGRLKFIREQSKWEIKVETLIICRWELI